MCGITGITDKKVGKLEDNIREMTRCITHRGPDDDGFYADKDIALGMRRLAIIDVEGGHQPIMSQDERFLIFFNGEIYNYKELKQELEREGKRFQTDSDTEVVLRLFESYGAEAFKRLRGMFALSIYDTKERLLFLARDPFGIKPLYYWRKNVGVEGGDQRVVAFSSEIKSFLKLPGFHKSVNDAAVYNYLSFQYNPLDETFFRGVYKLQPGHFMKIDVKSGESEVRRYFQFRFNPDERLYEEETREKIRSVMEDSVAHHMIADVPVGAFLSGGIDSSIIATLMQKIRGGKEAASSAARRGGGIKTFTVGFASLTEAKEARETSEPLGTDHTEILITPEEYFQAIPKAMYHFDEPVADPSALGLYFLAREARKSVKVVLSGEGSDELFGGYNIYRAPIARKWIAWMPHQALEFMASLPFRGSNYAKRALMRLEDWYIGNASVFKPAEVERLWKGGEQKKFSLDGIYALAGNESDSVKMQLVDINTWLVGDILAKADKMTMAHSLELRVPFLDIEVARLASRLPDRFKWRKGQTKYLLREAFRSVLPESTRKRKKLGFPTPVRAWFTSDREELYRTIVENEYILSHFDVDEIKDLIKDHLVKKSDNSRKIYLLLILAVWYNIFISEIA
jgi:asparagine synthase (glutamine-hydrolysing)